MRGVVLALGWHVWLQLGGLCVDELDSGFVVKAPRACDKMQHAARDHEKHGEQVECIRTSLPRTPLILILRRVP
jgi:hypothetical protein